MLKYVDAVVEFSEVPDEISLCIDFSNCPIRCPGCHSPYLQGDIGEELTFIKLDELIKANDGITCVCLLGGSNDYSALDKLFKFIRQNYPHLKIAWYTGDDSFPKELNFEDIDYIKLGSYRKEFGGLVNPNTNQRMYKIVNVTNKFWHNKV